MSRFKSIKITKELLDGNDAVSAKQIFCLLDDFAVETSSELVPDHKLITRNVNVSGLSRRLRPDMDLVVSAKLYDIGVHAVIIHVQLSEEANSKKLLSGTWAFVSVDENNEKKPVSNEIHERYPIKSRKIRMQNRIKNWSSAEANDRHVNHVAP